MGNCYCKDQNYHGWQQCPVCLREFDNVLLSEDERKFRCHGKMTVCGGGDYICDECSSVGWYSTAGQGGESELRNKDTNATRSYPDRAVRKYWDRKTKKPIIYSKESDDKF